MVKVLNEENFEAEVMGEGKAALVDFYADWCGPCKMMGPVFENVAEEHADVKMGKINIDEQPQLAQKYGVMSIPTLILFEKGQVKDTSIGLVPKEKIEMMLK